MRFNIKEKLFAVQFGYDLEERHTYGLFCKPLLYDTIVPTDINFIQLTVTEHHKVHNEWANGENAPDCDGYLLTDAAGNLYANQYPRASYGQTTDTADRRFRVYEKEKGVIGKRLEENPKMILEYHLLSDVLESMQQGIKELGEMMLTNTNKEAACEKRELLLALYDRTVKEFHEKHQEYRLDMAWKPPFKKSTLLWPTITYHKRITVEQAKALPKEEIVQDFTNDGRFEVVYPSGDLLTIERSSGQWMLNNELTDLDVIQIVFGEYYNDEGMGPHYMASQTMYFPDDWVENAVDAFLERFNSATPCRSTDGSMSLEAIAARIKNPTENAIVSVVSSTPEEKG